ncbi:hypothetical protein SDC9_202114 [bioreactor metagenome]|uniref:Uncharacterized protein n=1 Tax=bioreactor metagenome TaxID=1076179 RepID=A0A645J1R8_9ZZZZ
MVERSRMPMSDISSVRGMGVAESVRTSTVFLSSLIFSLCATPNRCSSSTTSSPRSWNCTSLDKSLCVPMMMSVLPEATSRRISLWRAVEKRLSMSMVTGNPSNRLLKVARCCRASKVVGTSTAACLPFITALKQARMATSVFP